ncbi:hypothetical protein HD554DRAFT_2173074 [Boletus coccyginus]|nr:hypothetical protein HD554DRAFT_2173074 [Boletus coccyginus]
MYTWIIEDSGDIRSIALSPHSSHLATGQYRGKITIRDLRNLLLDSYGPFHATARKEQPTISSGHNDIELETRSDDDLLEFELPPSTPAPQFDYSEPPSPASLPRSSGDKIPPPRAISQPLCALPAMSGLALGHKRQWTIRASDRRQSLKAAVSEWRSVSKFIGKPQSKPPTKAAIPSGSNKDISRSGQSPADPKEVKPVQQVNDASRPSAKATHQREFHKATISLTLPEWMLCFRSDAEDGMH